MRALRLDIIGILVSAACAMHCLLTPILLIYWGSQDHSGIFHQGFDVIILSIASIVMYLSMKKKKETNVYKNSMRLVKAGILVFAISFFLSNPFNHIAFVLGSVLWLTAHAFNLKSHPKT